MKKYGIYHRLFFIAGMICLFAPHKSVAQNTSYDSTYYITYPDKLMLRVFLSQKFAPLTISSLTSQELNYKTNSKLNFGVGATFKSVTLNLSYGFSFLNKDKGQGKTKGLDFQFHNYPHKWAVDVLGTFRKGFYLDPKDNNGLHLSNYYQRPDIKRDVVGVSINRVPNYGRFSYRAALSQSDWQIKSAGSLLYGAEAYFGLVKSDSALVPGQVSAGFQQAGINEIKFYSIGPGIGYAYTLVIDRNFFITGSAVGNLDLNFSSEERNGATRKKVSVQPGGVYKAAIGYNSSSWSVSANLIGNALYAGSASSSKEYFLPTGNFRFIVTKKLEIHTH